MALLSQSKVLAGGKAFCGLRARQTPVVSNGARATMKRKDSYMVEVGSNQFFLSRRTRSSHVSTRAHAHTRSHS